MKLWDHYSPDKEWTRWVQHSSTEDQLATVIRRRHVEAFAHETCPYADCDIHHEPLVLASDNPN